MFKEIKYLIFTIIIILFIFFTVRYYFSDSYKKKSYRSFNNIDNKIRIYSESLSILENDTQTKKKKKYYFWDLINKDD